MKGNKLAQLINCRIRVTLLDGRVMIGQLLAHDKHFNLVLAECEEFRLPSRKNKNKSSTTNDVDTFRRSLGMLVLRGEEVVSCSMESGAPPRNGNKSRLPADAVSSSIPAPGTGLTGPGVRL